MNDSVGAVATMSANARKFAAPRGMSSVRACEIGLAGVGDLGGDQVVEAALQLVGDPAQHLGALRSPIRPHGPRSAARAAATASSTRARSASATSKTGSPVTGLRLANRRPPSTNSPPTKLRSRPGPSGARPAISRGSQVTVIDASPG